MSNETELLPCPFCGEVPQKSSDERGLFVHVVNLDCFLGHMAFSGAPGLWNRRAAPTPEQSDVEMLERELATFWALNVADRLIAAYRPYDGVHFASHKNKKNDCFDYRKDGWFRYLELRGLLKYCPTLTEPNLVRVKGEQEQTK